VPDTRLDVYNLSSHRGHRCIPHKVAHRESLLKELQRCDRQIAEAEATLRSGYPDIDGCLLWLYDWRCERKLIEDELASMAIYQKYCTCVRRPDRRFYVANNEVHCFDCNRVITAEQPTDRGKDEHGTNENGSDGRRRIPQGRQEEAGGQGQQGNARIQHGRPEEQ
jgi:hypothetical protein